MVGKRMAGVLVVAVSFCAAAPAQPQGVEEERFRALEQEWMDALAQKNLGRLEALLAPEFTITGVGSTADDPLGDRSSWLASAMRFPWPEHHGEVIGVHALADVAVVHAILRAEYPPNSITPEGGDLAILVTDTWVMRDGRWHVLSRHASLASKD